MHFVKHGKRGLSMLLSLALLFAMAVAAAPVYADDQSGGAAASYSVEQINEYSKYFSNHVDGYRLMVQNDMEVDMSASAVRTVLRDRDYTIEVYRQPLANTTFIGYAGYSNSRIHNSVEYNVTPVRDMVLAGYRAVVLEWSRPALPNVENDKCYYAAVDLDIGGKEALSFQFKSTMPFDQFGSKYYILVLNTLTRIPRTAPATVIPTATMANPHWNEETRQFYRDYFSPDSPLRWGIYKNEAMRDAWNDLAAVEEQLDFEFPVVLDYCWSLDALSKVLANAAARGRTLELTLQPPIDPPADGTNFVLNVLRGQHDDFLNAYAAQVAQFGKPILLRLCNEMNGDWVSYNALNTCRDAEMYVLFYRYVYQIFERNGALQNTIWVWNPNEGSYPNFGWNHTLCYYPGDQYVDVVGLTGYNTGTYYYNVGERWKSFHQIYDKLYADYCAWFTQPMMITEFSCSSIGGDKLAWVREMLSDIGDMSRIKVAVWWDGYDLDAQGRLARAYYINDVAGLTELFRDYFAVHKQ